MTASKFMLRANRFPNYNTYAKELDEYLSDYSLNDMTK